MAYAFGTISCWFCFVLIMVSVPTSSAVAQSGSSDGGVALDVTLFPVYATETNSDDVNSPSAPETKLGFDLRTGLALRLFAELYVGFSYNLYSVDRERGAVGGGNDGVNEKTASGEYGPNIGYRWGGTRLIMTYFLSGHKKTTSKYSDVDGNLTGDGTMEYSKMSGFQFLIGYSFSVGSGLEIGPSLVYREVEYKHQKRTNAITPADDHDLDLDHPRKEGGLSPMLTLLWRF